MTKISVYQIDEYVAADDKWIGTDINTYNKTKNFTPRKLATYFNGNQVINTGVDLLYKYFTIDLHEIRPEGTISFEEEIGPTVEFSSISTFLLSKKTLKGNDVSEFLNFLVSSSVLMYKANNINLFGSYKILSVDTYLINQDFFVVNVDFVDGNGSMEEDEDYMISLIDVNSGGGGSTNLSYIPGVSNGIVTSSTGTDATIPLADTTNAGLFSAADKTKLAGIATGANVGVVPNSPITGATKTKITYDSKGLVTAGADATTADIADSTNKRYVTDANLVVIGNTSGTNTGDQNIQQVLTNGNVANTGLTLNIGSTQGVLINLEEGAVGLAVSTIAEGPGPTYPLIFANDNLTYFQVDKNGNLTSYGFLEASYFVKSGGTSSQILAADGSVITAGNNITITGGQISSVGGSGGGGSTVNYYLNGGTSQGTFGGTTYYEFSRTAILGTGADFTRNTNGYIASFITDVADPSLLLIPAGNWNLEFFFSSSSNGGSPSFYTELYKYDGTTFTLIASDSATPEGITNGTTIDAYFTALAVPETVLTVNDRLAIRVYVNTSGRTITLHTQNGHLCEVITTFTNGLTALNGLQAQVQNFAVGTSGTDFAIDSSANTHTFNLPNASATARGVVSIGTQTFAGAKTFTGAISASNLSGSNTGDQSINTLTNVVIDNLFNNDVLQYDAFSLRWKNKNLLVGDAEYGNDNNTYNSTLLASLFSQISNDIGSYSTYTNQTYNGTIVWTGGTAPSGATQHTYSLSRNRNLVTLTINLSYATAGASSLTSVACELPSTAPKPALPASVSAVGEILNYGTGIISAGKTLPTTTAAFCALRIKSLGTPNIYEVAVSRTAAAYRYAYITIQYFV